MSDDYREIEMEVEVETSLTAERLSEEVKSVLNASWDPSTGTVMQTRKVEVGIDEVDEDGYFGDPLTEESYQERLQQDLLEELRDAIKSAVDNL